MTTRRDFVKQSALAGAGVMLSAPLLSFNNSQNEKFRFWIFRIQVWNCRRHQKYKFNLLFF